MGHVSNTRLFATSSWCVELAKLKKYDVGSSENDIRSLHEASNTLSEQEYMQLLYRVCDERVCIPILRTCVHLAYKRLRTICQSAYQIRRLLHLHVTYRGRNRFRSKRFEEESVLLCGSRADSSRVFLRTHDTDRAQVLIVLRDLRYLRVPICILMEGEWFHHGSLDASYINRFHAPSSNYLYFSLVSRLHATVGRPNPDNYTLSPRSALSIDGYSQ